MSERAENSSSGGPLPIDPQKFQRQLTIGTLFLALMLMVIYVLEKFASIFQPLFIALLIAYVISPLHSWLVRRHVPSKLAYIVMLALVGGTLFLLGQLVYGSIADITEAKWLSYEDRLDSLFVSIQKLLPTEVEQWKGKRIRDLLPVPTVDQVLNSLKAVIGTFLGFVTWTVVVIVYLIFLTAEKFTFRERITQAFGDSNARQVMGVVRTINEAISQYIAVKTAISILAGVLTGAILALFEVEFAVLWGILTFLLYYIPYLGSIAAAAMPLVMALVQYADQVWVVGILAVLIIATHQTIGNYIEPKLLGSRLNVSPLLILLSLSFWGVLWGVVGMILSIPLLVVLKIILENIEETRPLAVLMSNPGPRR